MIEVIAYKNAAGVSAFEKWLMKLDAAVQSRIIISLDRMSAGNFSAVKGVGSGVYELRMNFGPGYRVYFGKDGERLVILLAGGTKLRQQNDIEVAHSLWQEYKHWKKELAWKSDKGLGHFKTP